MCYAYRSCCLGKIGSFRQVVQPNHSRREYFYPLCKVSTPDEKTTHRVTYPVDTVTETTTTR